MDKAEYIKDMRNQIATYRKIINKRSDAILDSAQSEKRQLRLKYMDLKDLLNELDKSVDKFSDIDDKSWEQVKVDIEEMWEGIRSEINKFNRRENNMRKNVLGTFEDVKKVNSTLATLEVNGYEKDDISVVSSKDNIVSDDVKFENNVLEGVKDTAKTGGIIGGILGLLVGLGVLSIPGIGLLFITGPIATALGVTGLAGATASGALTGSLVGGIAGALKEIGVDESLAVKYEEDIKNGSLFVGVKAKEGETAKIKDIFRNNGADHISDLQLQVRSA